MVTILNGFLSNTGDFLNGLCIALVASISTVFVAGARVIDPALYVGLVASAFVNTLLSRSRLRGSQSGVVISISRVD